MKSKLYLSNILYKAITKKAHNIDIMHNVVNSSKKIKSIKKKLFSICF